MLYSQKLEKQLENAQALVERRNLIQKLVENHEFRKIVEEGFFKEDCARFTHQSTDPSLTQEQRADALVMAQGAGVFKRFLNYGIIVGDTAERDIPQIRDSIEEARAEEAAE